MSSPATTAAIVAAKRAICAASFENMGTLRLAHVLVHLATQGMPEEHRAHIEDCDCDLRLAHQQAQIRYLALYRELTAT